MLRTALQQAERAGASCIASTSRSVHTATRKANTPNAPPSGQKRQQYLRKVKEKHELSLQIQELTKPDPYLGHQDNEEGHKYWQSSELCKVILSKDTVWGVREDRRGNLIKIDESREVAVEGAGNDQEGQGTELNLGPERINFGLDTAEDRQMLFADLPFISQQDVMRHRQDPSMADEKLIDEIEDKQWKGQNGVSILSRILDLKNASGKGIQVENTRRIIEHFGRREEGDSRGPDTGSVEVQAAVLTYRIRNLHEHLEDGHRHDNHNRRSMNQLVHQRASLLKYLRRKSASRYEALLPRIGVMPRAVEGEVVVLGKPRMKIAA